MKRENAIEINTIFQNLMLQLLMLIEWINWAALSFQFNLSYSILNVAEQYAERNCDNNSEP